MSALPTPDPKATAVRLVAELAAVVGGLAPEVLAELRPSVVGVAEQMVSRALAVALGRPVPEPAREFGFREAAKVLGVSERWLRGHRRELRIGYRMAGSWRFSQQELDRVRTSARRRARR